MKCNAGPIARAGNHEKSQGKVIILKKILDGVSSFINSLVIGLECDKKHLTLIYTILNNRVVQSGIMLASCSGFDFDYYFMVDPANSE